MAASKQSVGDCGATIAHRRLAVAAEHRLQEVGLLGLGRQAGRGPAALDVDDDQRQLEQTARPIVSALEGHARPRRRRDTERPAEGGAERDPDSGDLVLGLHRRDAEPLEPDSVQDVGGRGDRVGPED
jgi:hypothetical protein